MGINSTIESKSLIKTLNQFPKNIQNNVNNIFICRL